ncbi:hypothetical protein BSKO_08717 [Bryopsis sp. KO-2023]|nr:hypothetical protein BSKO_08717 [Bryopsis sp. KO-2023]
MRFSRLFCGVALFLHAVDVIYAQGDVRCPTPLQKKDKTVDVETFVLREKSWVDAGRDLQFVVDCLESGDILLLDMEEPLIPKNTTLITKPITIAAFSPDFKKNVEVKKKAVLTCPGDKGLFVVRSGDVTLSNLHIKDCWQATTASKSFSPVFFQNCGGQVELSHSKFEDNNYGLAGNFGRTTGAIRAVGEGCSLDAWNVEFRNLTGNVGAAVLDAVVANFTDVKFVRNSGRLFGAVALQNNATLTITNADFIGNAGVSNAGALSNIDSDVSMKSVRFVNNTGEGAMLKSEGELKMSLIDVSFEGNSGDPFAVCMLFSPPAGFSIDSLGGGPGSQPIGIDAIMRNVSFIGTINGTAFRAIQAKIDMENIVFERNFASPDGGGVMHAFDSIVEIRKARFVNNTALGDATLNVGRSTLKLVDAVFMDNVGEKGAGLNAGFSDVTGRNLDFHRNVARSSGGGMQVLGFLDLKNATFVDNIAQTQSGGGLDVKVNTGVFRMVDVLFIGNSAAKSGGAVNAGKGISNVDPDDFFGSLFGSFGEVGEAEDNIFFDRVLIDSNTAREHGGGVRCTDCVGKVLNTTFLNNTSVELGGGGLSLATLQVPSQVAVQDCVFRENRCAREGGGMSLTGRGTEVVVSGGEFVQNFAAFGGAVGARSKASITIDGVEFVENEAEGGGAIWQRTLSGELDLSTSGAKFVRNRSVNGGAIQVDAGQGTGAFGDVFSNVVLANSTEFVGNRALEQGGAVWVKILGQMDISDVTFDQNEADLGGGGMTVFFPPTKTSSAGDIANLSAITETLTGGDSELSALLGGLFGLGNTQAEEKALLVTITDTVFNNNSSPNGLGGGVQSLSIPGEKRRFVVSSVLNPEQTALTFRNVSFEENAASNGGGLYGNLTILNMTDVIFKGNSAGVSGGGMSLFLSMLLGERCEFLGNSAKQIGGGVYITPSDRIDINADFNCTKCVMDGNNATNGGAVYDTTGFPVLNFVEPRFENNVATNGGGGALYHKPGGVIVTCPKQAAGISLESRFSFSANPCLKNIFRRNRAREVMGGGGAYGDNTATEQVRLATNSERIFGQESGRMLESFTVEAFDAYDQRIRGGLEKDAFLVSIFVSNNSAAVVSGQTISSFEKGRAVFSGLSVSSPVGIQSVPVPLILAFEGEDVARGNLEVELLACRPGQVIDGRQCRDCAPGTFSTDPTQKTCDSCAQGGICDLGIMVPKQGWWSPGLASVNNFECISSKGCAFGGREALMLGHAVNGTPADFPVCTDGYRGVLCNSCQPGYGHTVQNFCRKCNSRGTEIGLIFLACIISLAAMVGYVAVHPITSLEETDHSKMDDLSTFWKVFVSHLQVLGLARFTRIQWPNLLHYLLVTAGVAGTVGLGDELLLDCAFPDSTVDKPMKSVYVAFVLPALFLLVLLAIFVPWFHFKSKRVKNSGVRFWGLLIFSAAAVCFHVYPFLAMVILSVFNCTEIDGSGTYWLPDTSIECLPVGMTIVVGCFGSLILLSVIVALLAVQNDITDTFAGGLIRPYKKDKYFWEAGAFSIKLAIACIMTFAAKAGVQVQMNLSMGVILMALMAQIIAKPYKHDSMNYLQVVSYLANALTFFQAIFVFDEETTTDKERDFMVAAIVIIHLAAGLCFGGVLLMRFRGAELMGGQARMLGGWFSNFKRIGMSQNREGVGVRPHTPELNGVEVERGAPHNVSNGEGGNLASNPINEPLQDSNKNDVGRDAPRISGLSEIVPEFV